VEEGRIKDAKIQVLGCPGAVASAMAAIDIIKGKTLDEVQGLKDRDIFFHAGRYPCREDALYPFDQQDHTKGNKRIQV
jgi:NifU-like protein involved in Fe-S cluster formation